MAWSLYRFTSVLLRDVRFAANLDSRRVMTRLPLTLRAQDLLRTQVEPGDIVIDATTGNGHDTLLLAGQVGAVGKVFAFDNQPAALAAARRRLQQAGLDHRVSLIEQGHERMMPAIPAAAHGRVRAVVFNLGYLPGGDKSHVTQSATTLVALQQAFALLMPGGLLSIIAYTGHPGGRGEAEAVKQWAASLTGARCEIVIPDSKTNTAPEWLVIYKT